MPDEPAAGDCPSGVRVHRRAPRAVAEHGQAHDEDGGEPAGEAGAGVAAPRRRSRCLRGTAPRRRRVRRPRPAARRSRHRPRTERAEPACSRPATSQGALAASTSPPTAAQRRGGPPTAPNDKATAVAIPALALSEPSTTTRGSMRREQARRPPAAHEHQDPRQAGPADEHRPVPDQEPLDHQRAPLVGGDHGQPADHREAGHQPGGAQPACHQRAEQDDLLQDHPGDHGVEHRDHGVGRARPGAGCWPGPGSRSAGSGRVPTPCRS